MALLYLEVNILLLFIYTRNKQAEVFILVNNCNSLTVKGPGFCVLVELYIMLGASYDNFCLVCVELQLVALAVVTNNLKSTLETAGRVCKNVGVGFM